MIKGIKSRLVKSIESKKINVFFIFLIVSFVFLLLSKLTKDYTKTITFKIEPINAKDEHVILKDTTHKLDITLRTYGFKFLRYYLSTPKITVDLKEIDNLNNTYIWTNNKGISHVNKQFNENEKILAINQDTIFFKYDVNFIKTIPIKLNKEITFNPGYDLSGRYILKPDSIKIIGPKILVDSINQIITETLSLTDVKANINSELNLIQPDSSKNIIYSSLKTTIFGNVDKFTEGTLEIPVNIINVPNKKTINYFPKSVNIVYYTSLSNFNEVKKQDFVVECDFNEFSEQKNYLTPKLIKYPENLKNLRVNQKQIEILISK